MNRQVELDAPVTGKLFSWILGFGSEAEVIGPQSLRSRILVEHEKAVLRYKIRTCSKTGQKFLDD